MNDLWTLTARDLAAEIARGAVSAEQAATACLDRIAATEDTVAAFVHLDPQYVLAQARALDEARRNGEPLGPLHGVPVAIKDIIDTADYATECGSALFSGRRPDRDATVVAKLRAAGAVIVGKTVTTELAVYHPGKTRNPRDPRRTPGGSSSGSAAAVAAGMVPLALGSQTNGSVIRPASYCGVYGMKPSHGVVSRAGVLELSRHLDHVGVFARSLDDIAFVLDVLAGYDPDDPDSRPVAAPAFARTLAEPPPVPPRAAFIRTPIWDRAEESARAAFEELVAALGGTVSEVDLPEPFAEAWDLHRAIMTADMAHRFGTLIDRGGDAASALLRGLIADGRTVTAVRYLEAVAAARRYGAGLAEVFQHFDVILTPATTGVAPLGLEATGDPAFCTLWTLVGLPALSVPLLQGEEGMPLGVQLVGASGQDGRLLRTARALLAQLSEEA